MACTRRECPELSGCEQDERGGVRENEGEDRRRYEVRGCREVSMHRVAWEGAATGEAKKVPLPHTLHGQSTPIQMTFLT